MAITRRIFDYEGPGGPFEATFVWDDAVAGPRPGVLVFSNVMGPKPFDTERAERLAADGHVAMVADMYGKGIRPADDRDTAIAQMTLLNCDRRLLQARTQAALAAMRGQPECDPARTAAIGFCFGGRCVLDLARSGADVTGVASFHGVYDPPPFANAPMSAKILVLHGWEDPLCTPDQTVTLAAELTEAKVDWQIHAYGHTGHGFSAEPPFPIPGMGYQADADRRSWQALGNFLGELWR